MYKDKIVVSQKLQTYVVKWYHMYVLHTVLDQIVAIILQHFTGQPLENPSKWKSRDVTHVNLQNVPK